MNLQLETLPGQNLDGTPRVFRIVEVWPVPGVFLVTDIGPYTHKDMASALHRLGGMVEWERWTPEAQEALRALNGGNAI